MTTIDQERLQAVLRQHLQGHASPMLMNRLLNLLALAGTDPAKLDEVIKKIHTAVKLFIDEQRALELKQELQRAASIT
jgi:hypothetical protein